MISSHETIAIDSRENKTIDLYKVYMEQITGACLIDYNLRREQAVDTESGSLSSL